MDIGPDTNAAGAPRPLDDGRPAPGRLAFMVRAFAHRNYRLFFAGQVISLVGTFLTQVAISWLVYRVSSDARVLGFTVFAGQIPMFVLSPFGGVWVDRVNRRKLLVITQALAMLQSLALAAVAYFIRDAGVLPWVIGLAFCQGLINAFDMPGRQAFLVEMVTDHNDLANAIALNSTMVHFARLIGPAAAGLLIYYLRSEWLCFFLDGLSYIAVIVALLAMRVAPRPIRPRAGVWADLLEGVRYVWHHVPIRWLLLTMAVLSLAGGPTMSVLMPIFAKFFSGPTRGSQTLGFLMASSGVGALCGAIYLASRRTVLGLGRVIAVSAGGLGFSLVAFSFSWHLWLSMVFVAAAGLSMIVTFAASNTVLQTLAEEEKRGRVMSFFSMAFLGMAPFGSLLVGEAAARLGRRLANPVLGASWTMRWCGCVCVAAAAAFALGLPRLRKFVRPIYVQRGIIPDAVASGIRTATEAIASPGE
jgi:MFS family permease